MATNPSNPARHNTLVPLTPDNVHLIVPRELQPPVRVTYVPGKNLYKKCVGTYQKDGTVRPKVFWLGRDQLHAIHRARVLGLHWAVMQARGVRHWTKEEERRALDAAELEFRLARAAVGRMEDAVTRYRFQGVPVAEPDLPSRRPSPANVVPLPAGGVSATAENDSGIETLEQGVRRYVDTLKARQVGTKFVTRAEQAYRQMYGVIPKDTPLRQLGREQILAFVGHFLARPKSKLTDKPLAVVSIKTLFQHVRALFDELDGDGWEAPPKWHKLFRVRWAGLLTPQEQRKQAAGRDTFELEELKELYAIANPRQRLLMLLNNRARLRATFKCILYRHL